MTRKKCNWRREPVVVVPLTCVFYCRYGEVRYGRADVVKSDWYRDDDVLGKKKNFVILFFVSILPPLINAKPTYSVTSAYRRLGTWPPI